MQRYLIRAAVMALYEDPNSLPRKSWGAECFERLATKPRAIFNAATCTTISFTLIWGQYLVLFECRDDSTEKLLLIWPQHPYPFPHQILLLVGSSCSCCVLLHPLRPGIRRNGSALPLHSQKSHIRITANPSRHQMLTEECTLSKISNVQPKIEET